MLIPLVYLYILLATALKALTDGRQTRKNPGALRVGSAAEREGAVRGLYGVFEPQPRTDRFCGRDGGEGGAGSVFGDGAGRRGRFSPMRRSLCWQVRGLIRSAAGAFGMLAVLAMALAPFARLGALSGAAAGRGNRRGRGQQGACGLISNLASAMGYMLAIAASTLWMSLVSSACFLKAVGG